MRTRAGGLAERLVEAAWLGVVVIVPVAFNLYSDRIFEVPKVTLFRSFAVVMLLASVVALLERGHQGSQSEEPRRPLLRRGWDWARQPLVLPAICIGVVYLLSTAVSVLPRLSLAGSYRRLQGTYTAFGYLMLFWALLLLLRTEEQMDRLVAAIVLGSLPVALYALVQRYRMDPLSWRWPVSYRTPSTVGNPIFLGAYLSMVVPLTARGLMRAARNLAEAPGNRLRPALSAGLHLLVLAAQGAAILFTQSRGPVLGVAGGLLFFALLVAVRRGSRVLVAAALVCAFLLGGLLVAANVSGPVRGALNRIPYLGRLAHIADSATVQERLLIWEGAANMVSGAGWRALVGHGPETMLYAFQPYIPAELVELTGSQQAHDRAHNAAWDALVSQGLLGLGAYLFLFGSVFYWGLRSLGLVEGPQDRLRWTVLSALGVLVGATLPWVFSRRWTFLGVGVSAGLLAAQVLYLACLAMLRPSRRALLEGQGILLMAVLSGIVAHFIEIQVGIPVAATRVLCWSFAAVIAVVGANGFASLKSPSVQSSDPVTAPMSHSRGRAPSRRGRRVRRVRHRPQDGALSVFLKSPLASLSLILGVLLLTLGTSYVTHNFQFGTHTSLISLLVVVWLAGAGLIHLGSTDGSDSSTSEFEWGPSLALCLSLALLPILAGLPFHLAGLPTSEPRATFVIIDYALLGAVLVAAAAVLPGRESTYKWFRSGWRGWLYLSFVVAAIALILFTNLNLVRATVWFEASRSLVESGQWNSGIAALRRASALAPGQPRYRLFLGR
ncbi:MAG: O-antigen ligase family protein, partial [Anaerolineae bacterium]